MATPKQIPKRIAVIGGTAYTRKTSIVGDPFHQKSWHGPQVSKAQYEKILAFARSARDEGATILAGGKTADNRLGPLDKGYYIEPTLVGDIKPSMKVYREETFGPFGVISTFSSKDAVVVLTNDTEYGLAAALFTADITRATRVSLALQAGNVWINSSNNSDSRVPFGGLKQSGVGRELGEAALEACSTIKAVHVALVLAKPDI